MQQNPHFNANQSEAGIGLIVGLAVIAVGGIAYLVLKQQAPAATTTAPAPAVAPAVAPAQNVAPAPPAVNPATSYSSLTPTKQVNPQQNYSGHQGLHGLQWLA
jgi:hypothetical protein